MPLKCVSPSCNNPVSVIHDIIARVVCMWGVVVFQMLGCLAVETAYPTAGLYKMTDRHTEDTLRELNDGEYLQDGEAGELAAGSHAEGLALEDFWGHGKSDGDIMYLHGGDLMVYILHPGQQPPKDAILVYTPLQCPHAYTRLQVLHKDRLIEAIIKHSCRFGLSVSDPKVQQCVLNEGGRLWLHSEHTLEAMMPSDTISGPAGQFLGGLLEFVQSLVCSGPHPAMVSYKERPRKHWPSTAQLKNFMNQPMLLVMVGPKDAQDSYLMFRISWSPLELLLISSLPMWLKQGYVCFKYTIKSALKNLRPENSTGDGRSWVGSYHLKTVFLRYLEEHPPQNEGSPFQLILDLCQDLQYYLLIRCLPHYFLPECDLLRTVNDEERQWAIQAVGKVIAWPLKAILQSPSEPWDIYGDHSPNVLIHGLYNVSSQPSCPERREDLQRLLRHLDEHREGLHRRQSRGNRHDMPGRVRLVDYLQ